MSEKLTDKRLQKWEQECLEKILAMTNDDLFKAILACVCGDDYEGEFTERGYFEYVHLEEEMRKRLTDTGFFREKMNKSISEMTSEELRIACAEKMGWKIEADESDPQYNILINPKGFYESIIRHGTMQDFCDNGTLPDYLFNRNALQELIVAVPKEKQNDFIAELVNVCVNKKNLYTSWFYVAIHREIYSLLTASPEAVMRAFLTVMEA